MSEQLPNIEEEVGRRLTTFVVEHAGRALEWVVERKPSDAADTPIQRVDFETIYYSRDEDSASHPSENDECFYMEVYVELSDEEARMQHVEAAMIIVEYIDDEGMRVTDEAGKLPSITDNYELGDRYYLIKSAGMLIDELQRLETAGQFVPLHQRSVGLSL